MSDQPKLYIAGMGMITPVGANAPMTAALIDAKMSAYAETDYIGQDGQPVIMAAVPDLVFQEVEAEIGEGDKFNTRHDRVIKMAIIAIREACAQRTTKQPVPLVLAMPHGQADEEGLTPLIQNLERNCKPWINTEQTRRIHSGRAAGIEAIDFVFRYLLDSPHEFFLIGGSDSYQDYARLGPLADRERLLVVGAQDGFAPGEAAGFLLLTRSPKLALAREGNIVALHPPGIAEEPGHLYSEETYRGDGLDQAFKQALTNYNNPQQKIHRIYSSMNGEQHWAKEYGVAFIRNKDHFHEQVEIEHPAEYYGDIGAATAPVLIALAAEHLFNTAKATANLVYSSSDHAKRGTVVVEKIAERKT